YNKQIDVYAVGVILYEMLTGRLPFEGESAGEILMKHLTTPPDLSKLPFEFVPVVSKALSKNPAHRYRTMAEKAKDVAAINTGEAPAPSVRPVPALRLTPPLRLEPIVAEPIPTVVPVSLRTRLAELGGSMIMAVLLAALLSVLWAAVIRTNDLREIGGYFF